MSKKINKNKEYIMEENNDNAECTMHAQSQPVAQSKEEKKTIEEWNKELNIKDYIFNGVVANENWLPNKVVTKEEFENAIKRFLNN